MRILVIDDDAMLSHWVAKVLREAEHVVDVAATAGEGHRLALSVDYELALVDLELPDGSGLSVVHDLRRAGKTMPILIMTGRSDDAGIVAGLNAGADDYMIKPVPTDVLRARVRAALRRGGAVKLDEVVIGDLVMDRVHHVVRGSGTTLALSPKEYRLLEYFMLRPEQMVPRTDLLEHVWGMRFDTYTNVVDTTVSRLRQKLSSVVATPRLRTSRGVGYALTVQA
ncbi:MAG: response regulator transcription factor [bacterium]